jgi:hypothetical protein
MKFSKISQRRETGMCEFAGVRNIERDRDKTLG